MNCCQWGKVRFCHICAPQRRREGGVIVLLLNGVLRHFSKTVCAKLERGSLYSGEVLNSNEAFFYETNTQSRPHCTYIDQNACNSDRGL